MLLSPVAYVAWIVFLAMTGGTFMVTVLRNAGSSEPLVMQFLASVVFWLTLLITVVCMRLFAEEQRSGTLEWLLTAPVTEWEAVLGKYAGALSFIVVVTASSFVYPFALVWLSPGLDSVDVGSLAGGGAFLLALSALCTAMGLLFSLLSRSQVVAAVLCLAGIWVVLLFGWMATTLPFNLPDTWTAMSAMEQLERFGRGLVDTRPVVSALAGTMWILYLAVRVLESRRWR